MSAAIVGLIGALLGAMIVQVGNVLADRRQARSEAARWRRDQTAAAYDGTIRHLLRFANRRSFVTAEGGAVIAKEHIRDTIDDLIEAQFWAHALLNRCGPRQQQRIRGVAKVLDDGVRDFIHGPGGAVKTMPAVALILGRTASLVDEISQCAREELHRAGR